MVHGLGGLDCNGCLPLAALSIGRFTHLKNMTVNVFSQIDTPACACLATLPSESYRELAFCLA